MMLGLLNLLPLAWRLIALAGIAVSIVGAYFAWQQHQRNIGWDRALKKVEQHNEEARKAASEVQRTVDQCYDTEGFWWNVATGKCEREDVK